MELPWVQHDNALARIGRDQPLSLYLVQASSPRRVQLEAFIHERFALQHGARVRHFMPCLFGLEDLAGQLLGAVGLRSGASGPLFLERYLSQPATSQVCIARPQKPRLGLARAAHCTMLDRTKGLSANPAYPERTAVTPCLFATQSPAPLCAGAAVACLSHG
ncbi:MAG: thermostable hemolysin [Pseudomonas sp.]|nr:thermostable hemolysin [Pseudomonas sp.]